MSFKIGDYVRCLYGIWPGLTIGRKYRVTGLSEDGDLTEIIDDQLEKVYYFTSRFILDETENVKNILSQYEI